jgi:UDP-2,4-diacetamido-2,4,6-trideoxy-beta-L-altropyranose hydrolase
MKQISALFRVEVSHRIGMGHLVRSLALAEELSRHDIDSFFILGEASTEHVRLVESKGFPAYKLRCSSGSLLDAAFTRSTAFHYQAKLCIVDGYRFHAGYYKALKKSNLLLAAIDDLGQRPLPVDLVINPNAGAECLSYPDAQRTLQGARYAILRREFLGQKKLNDTHTLKRLLITFGGTDPERATEKILRALPSTPLEVTAVIGGSYLGLAELKEAATQAGADGHKVRILQGFQPLSPLMLEADLAISAAGGTLLELAYLEIPTLAFAVAANQVPGVTSLSSSGVLCYGGVWQEQRAETLKEKLSSFLTSKLPTQKAKLIDGKGAARITEVALSMMAKKLKPETQWYPLYLRQEDA